MSEDTELRRMLKRIEIFWEYKKYLSSQVMVVLLDVAIHPGTSQVDIIDRTNVGKTVVNRVVIKLGTGKYNKKPGAGWVVKHDDPYDERKTQIELTPLGRAIMTRIMEAK